MKKISPLMPLLIFLLSFSAGGCEKVRETINEKVGEKVGEVIGKLAENDEEVIEAYRTYHAAVKAGDIESLKNMLGEGKASELEAEDAGIKLGLAAAMLPDEPEVESVDFAEGRATLKLRAGIAGSDAEGTVTLAREEGRWKIEHENWSVNLDAFPAGPVISAPDQLPEFKRTFEAHTGRVTDLDFGAMNTTLVSSGHDGTMRLWDLEAGTEVDSAKLKKIPWDIVMTRKRDRVFAVDASGELSVRSMDISGFGEPQTLNGKAGRMSQIALNRDETLLAATGHDAPIGIWNLKTGEKETTLKLSEKMRGVSFSPKANVVAAGSMENSFKVWNLDRKVGGTVGKSYTIPKVSDNSDVWSLEISPKGTYLATGHMDSSITIWDFEKRKELKNYFVRDASTMAISFSPDEAILATGHQNGIVYLWETQTGRKLVELPGHAGPVSAVAFSPDGSILASGADDGSVILWEP